MAETRRRLEALAPRRTQDIREHQSPVVSFSDEMVENDRALKAFLFKNMYRHYKLNRMTSKAKRVVRDLFRLLVDEPGCLPTDWQRNAGPPVSTETARVVSDYIAGMTDRYALDEYRQLFDLLSRSS